MSYFTQEGFSEHIPDKLLLFELLPTQVAVNDVCYQEIRPLSQVSDDTLSGSKSVDRI